MARYKLTYFNAKGRAETIRLIFAAGGTPLEDNRIEGKQWAAMQSTIPGGQLPILQVEGRTMGQSCAIARFAAKENGLAGKTRLDEFVADSIVDTITELREATIPVLFAKDLEKNKLKKHLDEMTRGILDRLQQQLAKNREGKAYFVGDSMTFADLHFFAVVDLSKTLNPLVLKPFPKLAALEKRVADHPRVAAYLKNRVPTPR